jgi:hypothetical protein
VRDGDGETVTSQLVSFRLSILQGDASGTNVYTETHATITNQFGLANLEIGNGTVVSGDFTTIDWGADDYFLEISFDITGGTNYLLAGTSQLMAVPYALYAKNSGGSSVWQVNGDDTYFQDGKVGIGTDQPLHKLDIYGNTRFAVDVSSASMLKAGNFHSSTDTLRLGSYGSAEISIDDNNNSPGKCFRVVGNGINELVRVQDDGRVGIGTNNPERLLHLVGGDARIEAPEWCDLTIRTTQPGTDAFLALRVATDGVYANDNYWGFYNDASDANKLSVLCNGANKFTIANDGKVGIGITNPSSNLDVTGNNIELSDYAFLGRMYSGADLLLGHNMKARTDGVRGAWVANNSPLGYAGIKMYNGEIQFHSKSGSVLAGDVASNEVMRLTNSGNLGVGITNPDSKLHVNGRIKASEVSIVSAGDATLSLERFTDSHGGIKFFETGETQAQWMFPFFRGWESDNLIVRDEKHFKDVMTFEYGTGRVGIGVSAPQSTLDVNGNITVRDGSENIVMELGSGLDYAEGFNVSDFQNAQPGTVLSIDPANPGKLVVCTEAYDTKVAGIVAGANGLGSGVRLGVNNFDCDVALAGRVYCNVDASGGDINPGDLLTTSNIPGFAMKVKDNNKAQGTILGKAMEGLEKGKKGQILVLVTLQ